MSSFCRITNERHGTHFDVSSFVQWNAWEIAHITKDEFFRTLDEAWFDWKTIPPTERNIGVKVRQLLEFGRIDIVTGRSPETVDSANHWLQDHEITFDSFVRTNTGAEKSKLSYDIFIDDSPDLMSDLASKLHTHGILYTQPWNKTIRRISSITRVKDWNQIPGVIREIISRTR